MSKIESLLDDETRAKLAQVAKQDAEPAFRVIKASTDPNPPRTLTASDAIDIDPESGAMIDALCVDCKVPLLIDPQLPEGVDPEAPRYPICAPCAKTRTRFAAISEQRNVEIIHRKTVARHQPRVTDGIDHPVTVTHEAREAKTKENDMDLSGMSDAELGAILRADMLARAAADLPAKRKKAKDKQAKAEAKTAKGIKQRQSERKGMVLEAFMVGTLEVPTLDLTEVEDLNEMVSTTLRSPYNKARFRLAGERPLWAPKDEDEDGYVPTTYQTLIDEHARLMALAEAKAAEKAKPKKAKAPQIVAVLSDDDEAEVAKKIKALRKITGLSKEQARAIVLGV